MADIQGVHSVEIAACILEAIAERGTPLRATDLAHMTGLSRSRLHKYLVSLCRANMIYQDPETNLYCLGNTLVVLGQAAEKQNVWLTTINNALCQLRDKLNISTGLVIRKGDMLSLVKYNRSNKNVEIDYRANTTFPMTDSAAGKVFLTFSNYAGNKGLLDEEERQRIIESKYAMRLVETNGIPGAKAIACPIYNRSSQLIGAAVLMGFLPDSQDELNRLGNELINKIESLKL